MITLQGESVPETMLLDRLDEVLSLSGEDILERIGTGHISPSAYDTGFVARVSDPEGVPMFPETLDWLVVNQGRDGSWGSEVYHEYDRFINTLSAAIALKERGNHPEATAMAEAYLTEAIDRLEEADEGVTSDHLVAMLMAEARRVGLSVPYERNPHKLSNPIKRALLSYIYLDNGHPLGFFAEILGRVPNQKRLTRKLQMENGSLVSAPSTTAASIVFDPNPVMDHSYFNKLRFLQSSILPEGGVLHFWDMETMERVYGLYNLMHVSSHERLYIECADVLESLWGDNGLTYGRNFPVPDLDDTAIGYRVLTDLGREPDPRVFDHFWKDTFFSTWRVHNRGLPGPNLHALEALAHSRHPDRDDLIQSTIKFLRSNMIDGNHFVDEWHLSAAYATSHAIPAFHLTEEALMERCVSFFLDTQHEDGSWGFIYNGNGLGTLEETALALQGLLYYNRYVENIDLAPVSLGVEYILERFPTVEHPKMWIAKVLIAPYTVIESSIVGALMMFRQAMTGSWNEEWRG